MSFHGGLLGIIVQLFFEKKGFDKLVLLDVVSCVTPVGIFFGRLANFINGELYGKPTDLPWAVIFQWLTLKGDIHLKYMKPSLRVILFLILS